MAPVSDPRSDQRIAAVVTLAGLYSLPAVLGLRPITDLDIWWHLKQGAWIVDARSLPFTDPFTSYGSGKTWIASSWLYELVVYGLYRARGFFGIAMSTTLLSFAIVFALHRCLLRRSRHFFLASGLTAVAIASMSQVLVEPRPWLYDILFVVLELMVLLEVRQTGRTRRLWALPPLFVVWACVSIQFIYGVFILFLAVVEAVLNRRLRQPSNVASEDAHGFQTKPLLLTLAGCVLATCLTPYHVKVYVPVMTAVRLTEPFTFITELQAPSFRLVFHWVSLGLLLSAVFVIGRSWPGPFLACLLTMGAFVALRAQRDVWVLAIASSIILSAVVRRVPSGSRVRLRVIDRAAVTVFVVGVSVFLSMTQASSARMERAVADTFPVQAAAFVESQEYSGRVYTNYKWGGFIMWRLPSIDVSMDGRTSLHGNARIWQSIGTWDGRRGWDSDPELTSANLVIGDSNAALSSLLRQDSRFRLVYEDDIAAVFLRQ